MGFGDKFNEWLKENGKRTLTADEVNVFNDSGRRVAEEMRRDHDKIVASTQKLAIFLSNIARDKAGRLDKSNSVRRGTRQ